MKSILIAVVALLVGAVAGYGYEMMKFNDVSQQLAMATQEKEQAQLNADRLSKANQDAVKKWGKELGKLVAAAVVVPAAATTDPQAPATPVDPAKTLDSARAILAARDGFRASLDDARAAMDSDLDALATELGNPKTDPAKVGQMLQALQQSWPDKQKNLDDAARKLLADLGILPPQKPAAAMTPPVAPAATVSATPPASAQKN